MKVLDKHRHNKPIITRACFTLGNLTFSGDTANKNVEESHRVITSDTGIPLLLKLLDMYDENEKKKKEQKYIQETEDLLTRLIRLIANVSTYKKHGEQIVCSPSMVRLVDIVQRKSILQCEELVLNIVRCISNLSFYAVSNTEKTTPLFEDQVKLAKLLAPLILYDHPDAVMESCRAFGNLSRDPQVRQWMSERRVDEAIMILLGHSRMDIVRSVCGILINLSNDEQNRHAKALHGASIVERLLEVLDHADIELVILILQMLFNLSFLDNMFTSHQIQHLHETIQGMLLYLQEQEQMVEYREQVEDQPQYDPDGVVRLRQVSTSLLNQLNVLRYE
ncbi:armadillo repeat-containing protein [Acrasis kona]|uniref:Armadillo repeat-containing protein n=1 Tax=Acrasis kona TaxID=1008807 RepID=A0AAW2ZKB5_9EUKA